MIIYNKTRQFFFVSLVRQTFLGFEMKSDFRDTSPLSLNFKDVSSDARLLKPWTQLFVRSS